MEKREALLPEEFNCPVCRTNLELEHRERTERKFTCPFCESKIDLSEEHADKAADPSKTDDLGTLQKVLPLIFTSNHPLRSKIIVTLAGIFVYRLGLHLHVIGVDVNRLLEFSKAVPLDEILLRDSTIFTLGIIPYLIASIIVLLLSGVIPYLRNLREGTVEDNRKFDRLIYLVTLIVSLIQAWEISVLLEHDDIPITVSWGSFKVLYTITVTCGTMLLVWIADQITKKGIVNGIALFVLVDILSDWIYTMSNQFAESAKTDQLVITVFIAFVLVFILTWFSILFILAKRDILLEPAGPNARAQKNKAVSIPIRVNTVGIVPILIVLYPLMDILIFTLSLPGAPSPSWVDDLLSYDKFYLWIIYGAATFLFTYIYTAFTFDTKDLANRIKRYKLKIAGMDANEDMAGYIDRAISKIILPNAIFLSCLAMIPFLIFAASEMKYTYGFSRLFRYDLLIFSAVSIEIIRQIRENLKMAGNIGEERIEQRIEWIPVFEGETLFDAEMMKEILLDAQIKAVVYSNRVMNVLGTLAFWEVCRPANPALTVHRRLGQGTAGVLVPLDQAGRATEILNSQQLA